MVIGAGVTVAELCMKLTDISSTVPGILVQGKTYLLHFFLYFTICICQKEKVEVFACLLEMLSQFGSPQANNTMVNVFFYLIFFLPSSWQWLLSSSLSQTLGGIVMSGSCSSDISPILVAAGSKLVFASSSESIDRNLTVLKRAAYFLHVPACTREVTITSMSFSGEESLLLTNEVLVSISLPYSQEVRMVHRVFILYKYSKYCPLVVVLYRMNL